MAKKQKKKSAYKERLRHRRKMASSFGSKGFRTILMGKNKGTRIPLPIDMLAE